MSLDWDAWKQLKNIDEDTFIDDTDREDFLYYVQHPFTILMEMANVRGVDVATDYRLPFSFYFSTKEAVRNQHGIRAKIIWNPSKAPADADGFMELQGDYEYVMDSHKYKPTTKELKIARDFFKKYKVLFAAVWEGKLYDGHLQDFFKGRMQLRELLSKFENITEMQYYYLNHCKTLEEVEQCVRKYKIFNMSD